jgi:Aspartyl protease
MRFFCGVILFCFAVSGGARAALPAPAAAIPFEYSEGLLWVQVQVPQSARPLNFIFDTGADVSVINAGTAKALELKTGSCVSVQGVQATMTGHWPARLTVTAETMTLPSKYLALDLSKLADSCGRPLDGLLGADFIRGRIVEIDFTSRQIRFPDKASPAAADTVVPLELRGHSICVSIGINGRERQWVRLDTGCATALQWVTADMKMFRHSDKPAVGLTKLAIPQAETTVSLGATRFDRVPTGIHHTSFFPGEAGLLGNGLLSQFQTVTIDTKSARLVLHPS